MQNIIVLAKCALLLFVNKIEWSLQKSSALDCLDHSVQYQKQPLPKISCCTCCSLDVPHVLNQHRTMLFTGEISDFFQILQCYLVHIHYVHYISNEVPFGALFHMVTHDLYTCVLPSGVFKGVLSHGSPFGFFFRCATMW